MPVKRKPKLDKTIFDEEFAQDRADRRAENHVDEKIESEELKRCFDILAWQMEQPIAAVFLEPVDWRALELPTYPLVVKNPMDYGTIKARLLSGQVPTPSKFRELMRLVYNNSMKFNQAGSQIHAITQQLLDEFEGNYEHVKLEKVAPMMSTHMDVAPMMAHVNPYAELESNIAALEAKLAALQEETNTLKSTNQVKAEQQALQLQPHLRIVKFVVSYPRKPFTLAQKEALCARLANMDDQEMVNELLSVISVDQSDSPGETLELDVESLPDDVLHKIQDFLDSYEDNANSNARGSYGDDEDYLESERRKKKKNKP